MHRDFRDYLTALEGRGKLKRVTGVVDKDWELSAIARTVTTMAAPQRYGLLFENVKGYKTPVSTNVFGSRDVCAVALETTADKIFDRWIKAENSPIPPKVVNSGLCKENILKGKDIDLLKFPIPTWTPKKDPAPFITGGCAATKDPEAGWLNVGLYRFQVHDKDKLGILLLKGDGKKIFEKYKEAGKHMPIAISIGPPPTVVISSVANIPFGTSEYDIAGALGQSPIELIKCETNDLLVPATSEIVIEGQVDPNELIMEGPFGRLQGYMGYSSEEPYVQIECITHRNNPIMNGLIEQKPPSEGGCISSLSLEVMMLQKLRALGVPGVVGVCIAEASAEMGLVISIRKRNDAHARQVMDAAWAAYPAGGKQVVIVEDDCNPYDPFDVEWHIMTRCQPSRDIEIIRDVSGHPSDPSISKEDVERGSKMGIDATRKLDYPSLAMPSREMLQEVRSKWQSYGLPPLG